MTSGATYSYDDLRFRYIGSGWDRATVVLQKDETAWNPVSTKHLIYGPATVTYERGPDGGVSAYITAA